MLQLTESITHRLIAEPIKWSLKPFDLSPHEAVRFSMQSRLEPALAVVLGREGCRHAGNRLGLRRDAVSDAARIRWPVFPMGDARRPAGALARLAANPQAVQALAWNVRPPRDPREQVREMRAFFEEARGKAH